jgi:predicted RNA-binding Zn-ribbon protein involved in translation (DUF1610 family)
MKNRQCPNCGSTDIYVSQAGGGVGGGFQIYVRNGEAMKPTRDWETHLCASCGYFENFILNRDLLDNIVNDPHGSGWKKAGQ